MSDFDGVFTDPVAEAAAVGARQLERLGEILGEDAPALLRRLRESVRNAPREHGWFSGGVLSCYADEDPYVFHNAVSAALYREGEEIVARLAEAGLPTHDDFSRTCFEEGTGAFRATEKTHLLDEAVDALGRMLDAGWEVVIVSNSSTDRVRSILGDLGLSAEDHERLWLRGGARKFVITGAPLDALPEADTFGERSVRLTRGHYYEILEEERPDAVIGDVLSLDLALPQALTTRMPWARDLRVHLKSNGYTPDWSRQAAQATGMRVVGSLSDMMDGLGA